MHRVSTPRRRNNAPRPAAQPVADPPADAGPARQAVYRWSVSNTIVSAGGEVVAASQAEAEAAVRRWLAAGLTVREA